MATITGAQNIIGVALHSIVDEAIELGAGDGILVESIDFSENAEELRQNPIGSGLLMDAEGQRGATSPSASLNGKPGYNDAYMALIKQFWGTETVVAGASGSYVHSFTVNETRNSNWAVLAAKTTSADVEELPGGTITSLTVTGESPPNYLDLAIEMLCNQVVYDSSVNTAATMANVDVENSTRIVIKDSDTFLINAQAGGALSGGDLAAIESITINAVYDQEFVREIKGAAGNGEPRATGSPPLAFDMTVQFRGLADLAWMEAAQDGDEFKAQLLVTGPIIGGAVPYSFRYDLPRLKLVTSPQHPISNAGDNPLTVSFKCFVATAAPTGMASRYPMVVVVNDRSTPF